MEAHGGYLCRIEGFGSLDLVALARHAVLEDGLDPLGCGLQLSVNSRRRVVRLAYDAPQVYGRPGAHWYGDHQQLALRLSLALGVTVHSYVFDPEEMEQVLAYGGGRPVGGEVVRYADVDLEAFDDRELSEAAFDKLKERWPLGHLARLFGITRAELLALPRSPSLLLDLGLPASPGVLKDLWDPGHRTARGA